MNTVPPPFLFCTLNQNLSGCESVSVPCFRLLASQPVSCLQSRLCSGDASQGQPPSWTFVPVGCPGDCSSSSSHEERRSPPNFAANQTPGRVAPREQWKQKLGVEVSVCVWSHTAKSDTRVCGRISTFSYLTIITSNYTQDGWHYGGGGWSKRCSSTVEEL